MPLNIQSDWDESESASAAFIKNKPEVVTKLELEAKVLQEVAEAVLQVGVTGVSFREGTEGIEYSTTAAPAVWAPFVDYDLIRGDTGYVYAWQAGTTAVVNRAYAYNNQVWRAKTTTTTNPVAGANWEFLYDGAAVTHNHDDRYYTKTQSDALSNSNHTATRAYALAFGG